jgi:hypothetical protein
MTQSNVERHHIRHSTPAIVVDRRSNCMGWLQVADADHAVSLKVRRPWQSFPKRWWTDGRQIGVDLYADLQQSTGGDRSPAEQRYTEMGYEPHPAHDKPLCGCRKEWRARMSFSCTSVFPQTVEDRSINGLWLRRCHCFCSCHHSDSPIQGSLATSNPFESNCGPWSCACDNFCRPPNGPGFVNDGDVVRFERDDEGKQCTRTTENLAYDLPRSILRQYVRSGDQRLMWEGEAAIMHLMDVDTCHHQTEHPDWIGGPYFERSQNHHYADTSERQLSGPHTSHTWLGSLLDFHFLTGISVPRKSPRCAPTIVAEQRHTSGLNR